MSKPLYMQLEELRRQYNISVERTRHVEDAIIQLRTALAESHAAEARLRAALAKMLTVHDAAEQYPHPLAREALAASPSDTLGQLQALRALHEMSVDTRPWPHQEGRIDLFAERMEHMEKVLAATAWLDEVKG